MFFDREQAYAVLHPLFPERLHAQEPLAQHCSFEVGGPADLWLTLETPMELETLIRVCTIHQWPLLLVGGGRNVIFADAGARGVVARIDAQRYEIKDYADNTATLMADAGVHWATLLEQLLPLGWAGLEFGIGIPGTLGAGLISNAGAHNQDLGQILEWIDVLDARSCNVGKYDVFVPLIERHYVREDLDLGYRHSRFRAARYTHIDSNGKLIFAAKQLIEPAEMVTRLGLRLHREDPQKLATLCAQYVQERQAHEPAMPRTGPIFKDPLGYLARDLIAQADLAGKIIGHAQINGQNANYIANLEGATAQEIVSLIVMAHQRVLADSGVDLMLNVEILGEWTA